MTEKTGRASEFFPSLLLNLHINRVLLPEFPDRKPLLLPDQIAQGGGGIETDHRGNLFYRIIGAAQIVFGVLHAQDAQSAAERGAEQGLKDSVHMARRDVQIFCDTVDGDVILVVHMDEFGCFQSQIQRAVRVFLGGMGVVDMAKGQDYKLPEKKIGRRDPPDFLFPLFLCNIMDNMFCLKGLFD